jgi:hypothetical protein
MAPFLDGKSIGSAHKKQIEGSNLENQEWGFRDSRIQFASNQSKLVPRKLDLGPLSKVGP